MACSTIKCDQNPALDDEALETEIHHAEEEIKNIDQTCKLIRETTLQKKPGRMTDTRKSINEKRIKIDYKRQARIEEIRAIFDTIPNKGDDTCSSEKELEGFFTKQVYILHFRTGCGKTTFIEEKQPGNVDNDALKQKHFDDSMERVGLPINLDRYSCRYNRKLKNTVNTLKTQTTTSMSAITNFTGLEMLKQIKQEPNISDISDI
ncbi:hypothetical protein MKW92_047889 [Papaver armeniacum]|nr:hypothetical protein MKW92_047889 [Papaver armeniacum]